MIWNCIEPQLGPVGRNRRSDLRAIPMWQLSAACIALFVTTMAVYMRPGPQPLRVGRVGQPDAALTPAAEGGSVTYKLGIVVESVHPMEADRLGLRSPTGALIAEILPNSSSATFLSPGDVIVSFNGVRILSPERLNQALRSFKGDAVEIGFVRDGRYYRSVVPLGDRQIGGEFDEGFNQGVPFNDAQWPWTEGKVSQRIL